MSISESFPDISFIDGDTLESTKLEMINDYQDKYKELTGEAIELGQADPDRLILYACAVQAYQTKLYVDQAGKMNFLKYSYGDFLDILGANKGVIRSQGKKSVVTIHFLLSSTLDFTVTIPEGTRVTAGDNVYFATKETVDIDPGSISAFILAECTEIGETSNGYAIGSITTMVDPIAYVASITNTTVSSGGENIESDESLEERIFLAPSGYVAGTEDAIIYDVKTCSTSIIDVKVSTDDDAVVNVMFITDNGMPSEEEVSTVLSVLTDKKRHVMTDKIVVSAPEVVTFALDMTYYINESDRTIAASIQNNVNEAVESYKMWQSSKIGRDINPSYLNKLVIDAGAKRCEIRMPVYTSLLGSQIALLEVKNITYGGLEND